ncbi:iron chelate uptake ABC transporter family permease subunit [Spirosoma sp. HMF4905]|uniref:Iron chelate uptake ABC transporter family permease subunit n=1 Tax=Spirosoma arboris TaxID=2682092 RepID=A0A7K1SJP3_9BACT|nr:iron ABC transporter permease [Spirosoma arboris]MVM33964.1 iron chelate uptake ABC transporter family permease subunit [Spirosoma arboris]
MNQQKQVRRENGRVLATRQVYKKLTKRRMYWLVLALLAVVSLLFIDILTGPAWLTPKEVFAGLFQPTAVPANTQIIVRLMRLPIALMAVVVGASLGVAGAEMQTILNNPLASPYTLGVSSAASFGAALAIVLGRGIGPVSELWLVPTNAFVFAILSSLLINLIAKTRYGAVHTIILTGVAFSFLFTSLLSFLQYVAHENELQAIVFWMFGSLQGATWNQIAIVSLVLLLTLPLLIRNAWRLTALKLGDGKVKSMGINVEQLRLNVLILIAVLTAVSVCFVGSIGFVGLVAPHLARWLVGDDQRFLLPGSALLGAIMLSVSSIASKLLIPGAIFPVGITTSIIGIPFLLVIILSAKRPYS